MCKKKHLLSEFSPSGSKLPATKPSSVGHVACLLKQCVAFYRFCCNISESKGIFLTFVLLDDTVKEISITGHRLFYKLNLQEL